MITLLEAVKIAQKDADERNLDLEPYCTESEEGWGFCYCSKGSMVPIPDGTCYFVTNNGVLQEHHTPPDKVHKILLEDKIPYREISIAKYLR